MIKTRRRRWTYPLSILMMLFILPSMAGRVTAQEERYNTLELVKVYQSEDEFKAAHPELFPEPPAFKAITGDNGHILFRDQQTGNVLRRLEKQLTSEDIRKGKGVTAEEYARMTSEENEVPVKTVVHDYLDIDDEYLMVTEKQLEITNLDNFHAFVGLPLRQTLYNRQGQKIANLPLDINVLKISPDKKTFVAYYDGEWGAAHIYFYENSGRLLNQYKIDGFLRTTYSSNNKYLGIFNSFGNNFYLFTKQGKLLFEGDISNYDKHGNLNQLFVSSDGHYMLLNTDKLAILIDHTGQKLWELPSHTIRNAYFAELGNLLILHHRDLEKNWRLRVISMNTGNILDELSQFSYVTTINTMIHLRRGDKFYAYRINE